MPKRKSRSKKRVQKRKLIGFTKTKGKFQLVFKRGKKTSLGKSKFSSRKNLNKAAARFLKK